MNTKNLIIVEPDDMDPGDREQILECWTVGTPLIVNGRPVVIDRVRWLGSGGLEFRYKLPRAFTDYYRACYPDGTN